MEVYHLGHTKYANQVTGEGARLNGGRWNHVGVPCIYASESQSLCVLEYAANVPLDLMPDNLSFTTYFLPDENIRTIETEDLPKNWNASPAPQQLKDLGTELLRSKKFLALKVPSAIIPSEFNYILNPQHPAFRKVKIKKVSPNEWRKINAN